MVRILDEIEPNDSDYIQSEANPQGSICSIALGTPATPPDVDSDHIVRIRYRKQGIATINLVVRLKQSTTTIATWTYNNIAETVVQANETLTAPQAASITDYSALRLEFEATQV